MNNFTVRLSVLDFFRSLPATLDLAPAVERLGYHRFWIAEHQPQPGPILAASLVASRTRRMRIGPAGILFHFYSPSKAAYDFQLLAAAYPGRIDAGFCAGWAVPTQLPDLLDGRPDQRDPATYQRRVATLIHRLRTTPHNMQEQDAGLVWSGAIDQAPEIWVHGTGRGSVLIAAEHGIYLSLSLFHSQSVDDPTLVTEYRERFCRHAPSAQPRVAIAVAGVCAETPTRAHALLANRTFTGVKSPFAGTPAQWCDELQRICERYAPDDIVIWDMSQRYEDRLASYTLLAEAVGLGSAAASE